MLGLFGTLNMGARSLQVQQQGIEVAGHNLANVNNPAYSRQRLNLQTSLTIPTPIGPQGTGADVVSIQRVRNAVLDGQIQSETSARGFLESQQSILEQARSILGQEIDRAASGPDGSASSLGVGGQHGIAEKLSDLFNAFQEISTNPTSLPERQSALAKAQDLATEFNQISRRLDTLDESINDAIQSDAAKVNELLSSIASINKEIFTTEVYAPGSANDLRDLRQQRIEQLAELVNMQATEQANGTVDISIAGELMVSGVQIQDTVEAYDAGGRQFLLRSQNGGTNLNLAGGRIQGLIEARDGALTTLRNELDAHAALLISEVNAVHAAGFSLTGSTGANFFQGANAADIQVNAALVADPSLLQASSVNGEGGNNTVALQIAQLTDKRHAALSNQTFSQDFAGIVSGFGQALASVNSGLDDQNAVETMLLRQREAISGVSLDEEMTDLIKFQKAFEASARLVTTIDEMLQTIINLKR